MHEQALAASSKAAKRVRAGEFMIFDAFTGLDAAARKTCGNFRKFFSLGHTGHGGHPQRRSPENFPRKNRQLSRRPEG